MKLLLIHPFSTESKGILGNLHYPPMGIAFLASAVREAGHDVSIIDAHVLDFSLNELMERVRQMKPDVVGISFTSMLWDGARIIADEIKRSLPDVLLLAGGYHPTVCAREVLEKAPFDMAVIGEGENTVVELLEEYSAGGLDNLTKKEIRGTAVSVQGTVRVNKPRELAADLDDLPVPAYDLLPLDKYSSLVTSKRPFVTFIRSRGCPYRCVFCGVQSMFERKYRCQSPRRTAEEMEILLNKYGVKEILFKDSDFLINRANVMELCRILSSWKKKVKWSCNARVDEVDEELLASMKNAGCEMITFGVESGDDGILTALKKDITVEQVRKACELTRRSGIKFTVNFMFGNPGETEETIDKSIRLAKELKADYGNFSFLTAFPGSELYRMAKENKWFISGNGSYAYEKARINATKLPSEKLDRILPRTYMSYYFDPGYIFRKIKNITPGEVCAQIKGGILLFRHLVDKAVKR